MEQLTEFVYDRAEHLEENYTEEKIIEVNKNGRYTLVKAVACEQRPWYKYISINHTKKSEFVNYLVRDNTTGKEEWRSYIEARIEVEWGKPVKKWYEWREYKETYINDFTNVKFAITGYMCKPSSEEIYINSKPLFDDSVIPVTNLTPLVEKICRLRFNICRRIIEDSCIDNSEIKQIKNLIKKAYSKKEVSVNLNELIEKMNLLREDAQNKLNKSGILDNYKILQVEIEEINRLCRETNLFNVMDCFSKEKIIESLKDIYNKDYIDW